MIIFASILFIVGICVGSFLNVLIDRLPRNVSVVKGRSRCEFCKKELSFLDLVPLISFFLLHGQCRYCKKPIDSLLPVVELTTGVLFGVTAYYITVINVITIIQLGYYLFIVSSLIVIFFADLKYGIIPDKIVYPAVVVTILFIILNSRFIILNSLLSALGAFLFFLLLFLATHGKGMGLGDVKFAFLQGLVLGWPSILVGVYMAFLTGALSGIILVIWRKKRFRGGTIPFGPFLVIGTIIGLFWGDSIWQKVVLGLLL